MDLRSVRHIVILSRRLSFTKAAEELGISQSALSRSIQAIERGAKARLFDRDRGGVRLTPIGRAFVERAAELLRDMADLDAMLAQSARAEGGTVSFGMAPLPAKALLASLVRETLSRQPKLLMNVAVRSAQALVALLISEAIEFFVSAEGQVSAAAPVNGAAIGSFASCLIVRAGHPALRPDGTGTRTYPLISSGPLGSIDRMPAYVRPYLLGPVHIIEDYSLLARITENSDAVWLSSSVAVVEETEAGRLQEILPPSGQTRVHMRIMLYSLDRRTRSPAASMLERRIKKIIRGITPEHPSVA